MRLRVVGFAWALLIAAAAACQYLPPIVIPPLPSPSPTPTATPSPEPSQEPVPSPTPEPAPAPSPSPCPPGCLLAGYDGLVPGRPVVLSCLCPPTPQPSPSPCVPSAGGIVPPPGNCKPCAGELAYLEQQGYYAPLKADPRFLAMDNCGSDPRACTYIARQPVTVDGRGFPACTLFNSRFQPRKGGSPEEQGICVPTERVQAPAVDCPPSPPPSSGPSDVARINIFHFDNPDAGCKLKGQPFVVPLDPPCRHREIHVTLTPKADPPCAVSNCDAQQHGRNVTWWAAGQVVPDSSEGVDVGCAIVGPMDSEPTFNRYIKATGKPCRNGFSLKVQLVAPDGKVFTAEKTVEVK